MQTILSDWKNMNEPKDQVVQQLKEIDESDLPPEEKEGNRK